MYTARVGVIMSNASRQTSRAPGKCDSRNKVNSAIQRSTHTEVNGFVFALSLGDIVFRHQ